MRRKITSFSIITFIFISSSLLISCSQDDGYVQKPSIPERNTISFTGHYQRQFLAGPGNLHTVDYWIHQDSIHYKIAGPIGNADYVINRDTFISMDKRFIGHTNLGQHYLVFAKDIKTDTITIFKQQINNVQEGLEIEVPFDGTAAFHGWNTFIKKES